jgi:DNA-binding transcriptional regulator YiaG
MRRSARIPRRGIAVPDTDLYLRTLRRAAELIGDQEALARRLNVTPSHLALWIQGVEKPPTYVFLRAVDLVSERQFPKN